MRGERYEAGRRWHLSLLGDWKCIFKFWFLSITLDFLAGEVGYTIKITQYLGHWQLFIGGQGLDVLAGLSHTEG